MSMKLSHLKTYWDANEAHLILSFLDELTGILWDTYGAEIIEQQASNHDDRQLPLEIEEIPIE